jgi:ABC-type dipeptide/oligopeptide/nickel transport system permease component
VVATIAFLLMKSAPGDPLQGEQALPEEILRQLGEQHGLHDSYGVQYVRYFYQLVKLDLGKSLIYPDRQVVDMIATSFPTSALLGLEALLVCVPLGILLGMAAALVQREWISQGLILFTVIAISVPGFILATLLQYLFGIRWELLPIAQWGSFSHTILPVISLAAMPMAFIARMTYTRATEELQQGYVVAARAKGFPPGYIIRKHVFRNVLIPILGYMAPLAANILTGSFVIEKIFAIPGLGFWFVSSVLNRDYPLIMGITVFYCFIILVITLCVDLIAAWVDPRLVKARGSE